MQASQRIEISNVSILFAYIRNKTVEHFNKTYQPLNVLKLFQIQKLLNT
jgi:hypothetical protein